MKTMRTLPNRKLANNFSLYEFIEAQLPAEAIALNWQNIHEVKINEFERLAKFLQKIRDDVNQMFKARNDGKEIGLRITSGFRCEAWELLRHRSGNSMHCQLAAADVQSTNCPPELAVEILSYFYTKLMRTHEGGLAIKHPDYYKNGKVLRVGFLHFDLRGYRARWTY